MYGEDSLCKYKKNVTDFPQWPDDQWKLKTTLQSKKDTLVELLAY